MGRARPVGGADVGPASGPQDQRKKDLQYLHLAGRLHYAAALMKTIKRFGMASVVALGLSACGGGADVKKLADEMCACKTKECTDAVEKKLKAVPEPKESEMKDLMPHVLRAMECQEKIAGGGAGGDAPAGGAPAGGTPAGGETK